jgi:hypothetical protein
MPARSVVRVRVRVEALHSYCDLQGVRGGMTEVGDCSCLSRLMPGCC